MNRITRSYKNWCQKVKNQHFKWTHGRYKYTLVSNYYRNYHQYNNSNIIKSTRRDNYYLHKGGRTDINQRKALLLQSLNFPFNPLKQTFLWSYYKENKVKKIIRQIRQIHGLSPLSQNWN